METKDKKGKLSDLFGVKEDEVRAISTQINENWAKHTNVTQVLKKYLKGLSKSESKLALTFLILGRRVQHNEEGGCGGGMSISICTNDKELAKAIKDKLK